MLYLISWYWGWLECKLDYSLQNINDNRDRLKRALKVITEKS